MEAKKYLPVIKQTPPEPLGERLPTSPPAPADDEGWRLRGTRDLGSTDRVSSNLTGKRGPHLVFCQRSQKFLCKIYQICGTNKNTYLLSKHGLKLAGV